MRIIGTIIIVAFQLALGCGDTYAVQDPGTDGASLDASLDGTVDAMIMPDTGAGDAGRCGDGVAGAGEACDGADLGGLDCVGLGFFEGTLGCGADCTLDTSDCVERCGNRTLDPGEDCDGANLGGLTCQSVGLSAGVLSCRSDCSFDLTGCPGCGNGVLEAGEGCDATDFGTASCGGSLQCTAQCHIDATGCSAPGTGTGADGALFVDSPVALQAPLAASWSVLTVGPDRVTVDATADDLAPGDEVLLINLQGTAAACGTVGVYEFLTVSTVAGSTVVFQSSLQEIYGVGGSNADLTGQAIVLQRVPNLSSLVIASGGTLTTAGWNGSRGGLLVLRVNGPVTVEAGSSLTVTGLGFQGGLGHVGTGRSHGRQGESICGDPQTVDVAANAGGGGGGLYADTSDDCGQGGGGGGYAAPGGWEPFTPTCADRGATTSAANGGNLYGVDSLPRWYLGSGGGSGGTDDHANTSGTGGRGGGILVLYAQSLVVDGSLRSTGTLGQIPSDYTDSGNGGGGSGGTVLLQIGALSGAGEIAAPGGPGGPTQNTQWNSPGGHGAGGRIRIDYQSAYGLIPGDPMAMWYLEHLCNPAPGYTSVNY